MKWENMIRFLAENKSSFLFCTPLYRESKVSKISEPNKTR
jgi:hypothetical protein